jgi:para-nitrobenzyl esterase
VAALQWIKANIGAFGGDPQRFVFIFSVKRSLNWRFCFSSFVLHRITIAGQSAGAISIAIHLTAPASFGLFQRAVVQSDPIAVQFRQINQSIAYSRYE